ncbi:predicted protein [Thalassiosira pseudonana CCMP1335]|uniref:Sugar phosphate transporter domain-containing protein n=1 Tax=Thalassiosira pseudonana TaxID=35128 RepID=B8LC62_THAPS|nr:predicted protein [Thalassiosira pseudonana CCMP1335]EED87162.1 predicted protein [Thalassiosira pseudonana CCMP1335]
MAIDVPGTISNGFGKAVVDTSPSGSGLHEHPVNQQPPPPTHDALQERMFHYEGFEFGFVMTLVEVLVMLVGSLGAEGRLFSFSGRNCCVDRLNNGGCCGGSSSSSLGGARSGGQVLGSALSSSILIRIAWVGVCLAIAHGLGNTALRYSPYPLKVAFKSCKLVPTMLLATFVTGRKHTALQYTAALVMGFGLAVLTAADIFSSSNSITSGTNRGLKLATNLNIGVGSIGNHGIGELVDSKTIIHFIGPILLLISTFFDSVVPNLQEQLLQTAKVKTSELIFVSNAMMCFVLLIYTTYSGELMDAWVYCIQHKDASGVLLLQGSMGVWLECF